MDSAADYAVQLTVAAPPDAVLSALITPAGVASWWTAWTSVTGTGYEGGELHLSFGGDDQLIMDVDTARATLVAWSVQDCAVLPDWAGTRPTFILRARTDGGTDIDFRHVGLAPALECFEVCRPAWDHYLANLQTGLSRSSH